MQRSAADPIEPRLLRGEIPLQDLQFGGRIDGDAERELFGLRALSEGIGQFESQPILIAGVKAGQAGEQLQRLFFRVKV